MNLQTMILFSVVVSGLAAAQTPVVNYPYFEGFDSVAPPRLPAGWSTSTGKSATGDFTTSSSSPHSGANDVVTSDAKIVQTLLSPVFDFEGRIPSTLQFYERRSSSFNAGVAVDAVTDGDTASALLIADTLRSSGATGYVQRTLALPASLSDRQHVQFRWRTAGDGTGSTGTMRIDDVSVTVKKLIDLAVASIAARPARPRGGESVGIQAWVSNKAMGGTFQSLVRLFDLHGADTTRSSSELIDQESVSLSLASGDSTAVVLHYPSISSGTHRLTMTLDLTGDEDTTNNTAALNLSAGYPPRSIAINEIMYAPQIGPEWIECMNLLHDTLSLSGWKVGDATTARVEFATSGGKAAPGEYFIIAKDTSIRSAFPNVKGEIFKASFPSLNNDGDAVVILDPADFMIDSVAYRSSWGGTGGKSLERVDTSVSSLEMLNWGSSHDPAGATPGFVNSLTKKNLDVAVERLSVSPVAPVAGEQIQIGATIRNVGRETLRGVLVSFFQGIGSDSLPRPENLWRTVAIGTLAPSDSLVLQEVLAGQGQGRRWIIVRASISGDEDATNNSSAISLLVGVKPRSVVINEIMYAPVGAEPEWVELYNTGTDTVDAAGWKISDSNVKNKVPFKGSKLCIDPSGYLLVSPDSTVRSFFSISCPLAVAAFLPLNNTSPDAVVIYESGGSTMDSVWYKPSWGGTNGQSLERVDYGASSVDSSNWISSLPTPGRENNAARKDLDVGMEYLRITRETGGFLISSMLRNFGRKPTSSFTFRLSDDRNNDSTASPEELFATVAVPSISPGDSLSILYHWKCTMNGKRVIIGKADLAGDERPENNQLLAWAEAGFQPMSVVVNEILYDPPAGGCEFVELFNRTADTLDLRCWEIMDSPSGSGGRHTCTFPDRPLVILPHHYLVLAADSSVYVMYSRLATLPAGSVIVANKDLSLNDNGDDVILHDLTGAPIDSIHYSTGWNNPALKTSASGKSLERINPSAPGNDAANWTTCVAFAGATPGEQNSVFAPSIPASAHLTLSPNPFSPDDESLSLSYSLPARTSMIRVRCFDAEGRLVCTLANNQAASSTGVLSWNGRDERGRRVRIGMYIIYFEARDAFGSAVVTLKDVAVVARKL